MENTKQPGQRDYSQHHLDNVQGWCTLSLFYSMLTYAVGALHKYIHRSGFNKEWYKHKLAPIF